MTYLPHLIAMNLSYILMVWFFISLLLSIYSKSQNTLSSFTLFLVWAFYSYALHYNKMAHLTDPQVYEAVAWFDLITALILTMWLKGAISRRISTALPYWLRYDSLAWAYALIILVAAICHFVMLNDVVLLLGKSNALHTPSIIYVWYDELIILTQILQIMVAGYGMVKSIRTLIILHKTSFDYSAGVNDYIESLQRQKTREART
jgi:hypothetical protein